MTETDTFRLLEEAKQKISDAKRAGLGFTLCPVRLLADLVEHIEAGHD